jgi:hypothetical protein
MTTPRTLSTSVAALALLAWARGAFAQEATAEAARRELIAQATRASDHDDHARAVELLDRAAQVRMSTSLRQFLADALVHTRAWLRAYVEAVQCQREANADASLAYRREILRDCARAEARARPHLGQLVVNTPADVAALRVSAGGAEVPRAFWSVQYPVSAGTVMVEATTDDGRIFRTEVTVPEGQERAVTITLPPPPPPPPRVPDPPVVPPTPPATRVVVSPPPPATPPPRRDDTTARSPALRTAAWVTLGVGAAGVAAGVITTVLAGARAEDFNAMSACGEAEVNYGAAGCAEAYDRAVTMRTLAVTSWVVAGLGVAAGAVLFVLPGGSNRAGAHAQPRWWIAAGPGSVGASIGARY